jgi:hypothetical protein
MKAQFLRSNRRLRSIASVRSTTSQHRMLEPLFRHHAPEKLEWRDALALFEVPRKAGHLHQTIWMMDFAGERHRLHAPRDKDLTGLELIELRRLMQRAGRCSMSHALIPAETPNLLPTLLVAIDKQGARIYRIGADGHNVDAQQITPCDPHHFARHPANKPEDRGGNQRASEASRFHDRIAAALVASTDIVVVGHAVGHGNAADHLVEHLRGHHPETYARVAGEVRADLTRITAQQLLEIGQQVLR